MANRTIAIFSPVLTSEASSRSPLYQQIYESLRDAILSRRLPAGGRLPSTRSLATELGISRNTVINAFDQLYAEGYLEGKIGSGTYVTHNLPDDQLNVRNSSSGPSSRRRAAGVASASSTSGSSSAAAHPSRDDHQRRSALSRRGAKIASVRVYVASRHGYTRPFAPGVPALDAFPFEIWGRLVGRRWRRPPKGLLGYGDPAGYLPLRKAIAAYLGTARAVRCDPEQVIIVAGTQQAIDLSARMLLDQKSSAWIEEYNYLAARSALLGAGAQLVPVPIDDEGLVVAEGVARAPRARLVYVSPSHQYPLGVTMSLKRRLALLEWARENGSWILEDDYDSEFRYAGRPLSALQGLDRCGRVIYMGTFSKVLFPALRLGYLVAPPDIIEPLVNARAMMGWCSPVVEQATLADFINEGHFARHIRRMRSLYAERQAALVEAVERESGGLLRIQPGAAGMHLVGWLPPNLRDQAVAVEAARHGIEVQPLSLFSMSRKNNRQRNGLVLGYGAYDPREIKNGVRKLSFAIKKCKTKA